MATGCGHTCVLQGGARISIRPFFIRQVFMPPGMAEGMNISHDFMPLAYIAIFSFPLHNKCVDVPSALITLTDRQTTPRWSAMALRLV